MYDAGVGREHTKDSLVYVYCTKHDQVGTFNSIKELQTLFAFSQSQTSTQTHSFCSTYDTSLYSLYCYAYILLYTQRCYVRQLQHFFRQPNNAVLPYGT